MVQVGGVEALGVQVKEEASQKAFFHFPHDGAALAEACRLGQKAQGIPGLVGAEALGLEGIGKAEGLGFALQEEAGGGLKGR